MVYLETYKLSKVYKKSNTRVEGIEDVSMLFEGGNICTLLGPNGSGKTTLIKTLCSEIQPDSGDIKYMGHSIFKNKKEIQHIKRKVGYAPENPFLYSRLKGKEFLEFMACMYEVDLKKEKEELNYLIKGFEMDKHMDKLITDYSQGMVRKLSLIMALLFGKKVIIMDEPTNGLDPTSYLFLLEILKQYRQEKRCVLLSTHQLDMAEELTDHLILVLDGHIVYDGKLTEKKNLRELYMENISLA
ncbi:MAG: ABC transporter ATP-binding protein [Lachnospiraceae bacterium]|nr:ABC transporter ATP-binding protein [Lachnospiraceae bacterium]